jgi:hypothetical protein
MGERAGKGGIVTRYTLTSVGLTPCSRSTRLGFTKIVIGGVSVCEWAEGGPDDGCAIALLPIASIVDRSE